MKLEKTISDFLKDRLDPSKPVLLGISGGPDSLALLYLLLDYRKRTSFDLALAHVDHGWREESDEEAQQLQEMARDLHLSFYIKKLSPIEMQGNLEAACREARYQFFAQLVEQYQFQAVVVAHHADDQAETVLKRIFEGSHLPNLAALQNVSQANGVTIWRPLLAVSKKTIVDWLEQHQLSAFHDVTNLDPKFLRGRFRTQIIPYLNKMFGKEICNNLCHLSEEAQELKEYLKKRVSHHFSAMQEGDLGTFLDFSKGAPPDNLELKFVLHQLFKQKEIVVSRDFIQTACELILDGSANRKLIVGSRVAYIDRRRFFILKAPLQQLPKRTLLQEGETIYGPWHISVSQCLDGRERCQRCLVGWKAVWEGRLEVVLPAKQYELGPVELHAPYPGQYSTISKWWTNEKVPAFLRHYVPVIWEGNRLCYEFLSGRPSQQVAENKKRLHICLKRNDIN